jgi:hypothetical protein
MKAGDEGDDHAAIDFIISQSRWHGRTYSDSKTLISYSNKNNDRDPSAV